MALPVWLTAQASKAFTAAVGAAVSYSAAVVPPFVGGSEDPDGAAPDTALDGAVAGPTGIGAARGVLGHAVMRSSVAR